MVSPGHTTRGSPRSHPPMPDGDVLCWPTPRGRARRWLRWPAPEGCGQRRWAPRSGVFSTHSKRAAGVIPRPAHPSFLLIKRCLRRDHEALARHRSIRWYLCRSAPFTFHPAGVPETHAVVTTVCVRPPQQFARIQARRWCDSSPDAPSALSAADHRIVGVPGMPPLITPRVAMLAVWLAGTRVVPDPCPFRLPDPPSWQPFVLLGSVRRQGPNHSRGRVRAYLWSPVARWSWLPAHCLRQIAPPLPGITEHAGRSSLPSVRTPRTRGLTVGYLTSQARATFRYGLPSIEWRLLARSGAVPGPGRQDIRHDTSARVRRSGRTSRPVAITPRRSLSRMPLHSSAGRRTSTRESRRFRSAHAWPCQR
jgi:hypothetical protein